jgi:hypothetical protein
MFYPVTLINTVYQMLWVDNCLDCLTWEWLCFGYEIQLNSVYEMCSCLRQEFKLNMENQPKQQYNHSPHGSG